MICPVQKALWAKDGYRAGDILCLKLDSESSYLVKVRVLECYRPFTLSCVLSAEILDQPVKTDMPSTVVLKIYDRRFAAQLREDFNIGSWNTAIEASYVDLTQSGEASRFIERLGDEDDGPVIEGIEQNPFDDPIDWGPAEGEALLYHKCRTLYTTEKAAYTKLSTLKSSSFPRYFGTATVHRIPSSPPDVQSHPDPAWSNPLATKALILSHHPGPTLSCLTTAIPQQYWRSLIDKAVATISAYSTLGIINNDIRPCNFIIYKDEKANVGDDKDARADNAASRRNDSITDCHIGEKYKIIMVDFALCLFRGQDESDANWDARKARHDEQGALVSILERKLSKLGYECCSSNISSHETSAR